MTVPTGALAQAALFSQIGGTATSAVGSYFGASTQKANARGSAAMADANARIATVNADIAELGAQSALNQGQQQIGALTLKAGQLKSSQRTALAANGVDLGEGNAAEIQASGDIMKEIDVNTLTANAIRSAWGYRTQGLNAQAQASSYTNQANAARATGSAISPIGAAGTSLLGGAGSVATSWYQLNKSGALDGTIFGSK